MKRVILFVAAAITLGTFSAGAWMYNTSCGRAVQTVPPEYFDNPKDRNEFYKALDDYYCGKGEVTPPSKQDQPDKPTPSIP